MQNSDSVDFNYNSFGDPGAHAFLNALETTKDGSNNSHIKQLAITNQISADLFDRLYRTTRGSKKGAKSKKEKVVLRALRYCQIYIMR